MSVNNIDLGILSENLKDLKTVIDRVLKQIEEKNTVLVDGIKDSSECKIYVDATKNRMSQS